MVGTLEEVTLEQFYSLFEDYVYVPKLGKKDPKTGIRPPLKNRLTGEAEMQIDHSLPKTVPVEIKAKLDAFLAQETVDGFVVFENVDLGSSELGRRSALPFGSSCATLKKAEDALGQHLGDVPSRFQYPRYVYRKDKS